MVTSVGKIEAAGWFRLKPISGFDPGKLRFVILGGKDAAPFKFNSICIDMETVGIGNTIDQVLRNLFKDTVHYVNIALEDFDGDKEKVAEAFAEDMRHRSDTWKNAEQAYAEIELSSPKIKGPVRAMPRTVTRGLKKEGRGRFRGGAVRAGRFTVPYSDVPVSKGTPRL